ncbi:hypothetical protein [Azospirillum largimobile]
MMNAFVPDQSDPAPQCTAPSFINLCRPAVAFNSLMLQP